MTAATSPVAARHSMLHLVAGIAYSNGLSVADRDAWCVCTCADDRHEADALATERRWVDGGYETRALWRTDRDDAVSDRALVGGSAHIVWREARVVTGPIQAELDADQPDPLAPYDPQDPGERLDTGWEDPA